MQLYSHPVGDISVPSFVLLQNNPAKDIPKSWVSWCNNASTVVKRSNCYVLYLCFVCMSKLTLYVTILKIRSQSWIKCSYSRFVSVTLLRSGEKMWEQRHSNALSTLWALSVASPRVWFLWTSSVFSLSSPLLGRSQNRWNWLKERNICILNALQIQQWLSTSLDTFTYQNS